MNVVLWIVAGVLALAFAVAGATKISQPKEKLASSMAWTEDFSARAVRGIGTLEVLGALGLILPAVTGIAPVLVPAAAVGLVLLMIGAAITHARRGEPQVIGANLTLALLAAFVAWGRFGAYSF